MSDVGGSFAYPFRHPAWFGRVLVGAALDFVPLVLLLPGVLAVVRHRHAFSAPALALLPVAAALGLACRLLVLGYLGRAAAEIVRGTSAGLPPWDRMADDFIDGLKLWLVALALWLPAVAGTAVLALLIMALTTPALAWVPVIVVGIPAALATLAYLPAGLLAMIAEGEAGAAFAFERVTGVAGRAFGPYAVAFLVAFGAEIFAQFGLIVCCVGIFATRFIAHCVAVHAFAAAFREGSLAAGAGVPSPAGAGTSPLPPG